MSKTLDSCPCSGDQTCVLLAGENHRFLDKDGNKGGGFCHNYTETNKKVSGNVSHETDRWIIMCLFNLRGVLSQHPYRWYTLFRHCGTNAMFLPNQPLSQSGRRPVYTTRRHRTWLWFTIILIIIFVPMEFTFERRRSKNSKYFENKCSFWNTQQQPSSIVDSVKPLNNTCREDVKWSPLFGTRCSSFWIMKVFITGVLMALLWMQFSFFEELN